MALAYGFAGLRDGSGETRFRPRLPAEWTRLQIPLTIRGRRIRVSIDHEETVYRLEAGDALEIIHEDETVQLTPAVPEARRPTTKMAPDRKAGSGAVDPAEPDDST